MPELVPVAKLSDLPAGSCKELEHRGRLIAIFHVAGQIHAMDGICPHAGGPLAAGHIEGSIVTCPWHGWQFDLNTGCNVYNLRLKQITYEVRVEGDDILLALP